MALRKVKMLRIRIQPIRQVAPRLRLRRCQSMGGMIRRPMKRARMVTATAIAYVWGEVVDMLACGREAGCSGVSWSLDGREVSVV
jgi:hypothetical protein